MATVAILGAGVMGEALLSGLRRSKDINDTIIVAERRAERAAELIAKYSIDVVDNQTAAKTADVLVLVVKPQDMSG
ncbi:MAG: hypothetical protein RL410_1436, partial [Actinomycetota bacterium]